MNRNDALMIVNEFVKNPNLVNHMLAVEAAMQFYAKKLDQNEEAWRITGLLHDYDWEIHPTLAQHPTAGIQTLRERGVSEEIIHSILAHGVETGIARVTLLDKGLFACDEITGLITAVAIIRPSRSLYDLTSNSIKKKWKDRAFAAGVNREEIVQAANDFGIDLGDHIENVIFAMRGIAPELGLVGTLAP